jgi:hypothetical protein
VLNSRYLFLIVYRLHLYKTLCKLAKMEESDPVPETILEEAEEATRQLLPAKSREHCEKVFSEFNDWKEEWGVMTINEEVLLSYYYSTSGIK